MRKSTLLFSFTDVNNSGVQLGRVIMEKSILGFTSYKVPKFKYEARYDPHNFSSLNRAPRPKLQFFPTLSFPDLEYWPGFHPKWRRAKA